MASHAATTVDFERPVLAGGAALQHRPWISKSHLSSGLAGVECFLSNCSFTRAPWLAVAFGTGAIAWFFLSSAATWAALCVVCVAIALFALNWHVGSARFPYIRQAILSLSLVVLAGCLSIWTRSEIVGQPAIERTMSGIFTARVLSLEEQPALQRDRLTLALREPRSGRSIKVRVNLPTALREQPLSTGAVIRFRGRLTPPASPMFPGGYDFARAAWFSGLSATGSITSPVEVISLGRGGDWLADQRAALSRHITTHLAGSPGGIAAALTTGDMGAIGQGDAQAMRDAGLAHLLSISGLHVSAVIGCVYFVVLRLLALFPALALRVRLPILAATCGAAAGLGYTLLSGSQVPTMRAFLGALLVLAAMAWGREALSMRLLAVAAVIVLVIWPESVVGPSFQMSFAAVMVLVALGNAEPLKRWLAPREEAWPFKAVRNLTMILITGIAIEFALMPIALFHFHRAGLYGSVANVIAIPLTTLVIMPFVALALLLDVVGLGGPVWWLANHAIDALLAIARFIAAEPRAVRVMPTMSGWHFALFVAGGLWLGLWDSRIRLWGILPIAAGFFGLMLIPVPDIMVSGDGRHVGWIDPESHRLVMLRAGSGDFALDNLMEVAGTREVPINAQTAPGTRCNADFCAVELRHGVEARHVLIARGRAIVPEMQLSEACGWADVVIAERRLPRTCRPKWLKVDRQMLDRTGGLTIDLASRSVTTVAEGQGNHGWWKPAAPAMVERKGWY
ncbi:ComEC/Rec2 family competence protein [Novosphingobium sp. PhB55]|uniref:ComEC/Rec2 family competence protein n=1 Tax=Novosphingobium sp. PhB55 TaxID=2485106 RepID=UPI00106610C2|nr:ComEC/Rec2 family competence protein [Novosphingobium sp. PhB55]